MHFEHVVSAPDFTDQQRQLLSTKVGAISEQFAMLFSEESGLKDLVDASTLSTAPSTPQRVSSMVKPVVAANVVLALRQLVQRCHDALSSSSRDGRKGSLLRELLSMIDHQSNFTEGQIKHMVMQLTRVAASYRETWFFQAAYGQTRSAQVLIKAIKDPELNRILPLASILEVTDVSDASIQNRLTALRDASPSWQEPSHDMRLQWPDNAMA